MLSEDVIEPDCECLGTTRIGSQSVPNSVSKVYAQVAPLALSFRMKGDDKVRLLLHSLLKACQAHRTQHQKEPSQSRVDS